MFQREETKKKKIISQIFRGINIVSNPRVGQEGGYKFFKKSSGEKEKVREKRKYKSSRVIGFFNFNLSPINYYGN